MSEKIPKVFVLDVDGVLSTGQFLYNEEGKAFKIFGPHDFDGLKLLKDKLKVKFISADKRGFPISYKRIVDDMGFELDFVSEEERFQYITQNYDLNELIFMGDGYYDVKILKMCRFGITPFSARKEAKEVSDYITESKAGQGAVLDACLEILKIFFIEDL